MEKDPRIYTRHILEAIANIETDTAGCDFDTYPTVLWDTCKKDLTPLKEAVLRIAGRIGA
jgi:uncharacterized protein with HEPN domain